MPTPYPELNAVLAELVSSAQGILGDNFCGAYVHGSFALGDADEHSDVDFLIVTHDEVSDEQLAGLQAMHKRLYASESPWAQHLEGSYAPRDRLQRVDPSRSSFWYLDNGASELIWDNHCNLALVRWMLREHGIALAGPDPKSLVDPVSAAQLQSEAEASLQEYADWARGLEMSRRAQGLLVLSFCRMLRTLDAGRVVTKREAGEWALRALAPAWSDLIQNALDDRPDPWLKVREPADPEAVTGTLAFIDYTLDFAATRSGETRSAAR